MSVEPSHTLEIPSYLLGYLLYLCTGIRKVSCSHGVHFGWKGTFEESVYNPVNIGRGQMKEKVLAILDIRVEIWGGVLESSPDGVSSSLSVSCNGKGFSKIVAYDYL